jgi:predicted dehydrogenase
MAEKKLKFGILGYGSIGKRHYQNLRTLGYEPLVYDPNNQEFRIARDAIIETCDAILICTPTGNHIADMADAIHAGKHVFVEKPIGYDHPELIGVLIAKARLDNASQVIATGFNLRFHECVRKAKSLLKDGILGGLIGANFSVLQKSSKPEYLRDGVIRNWACHEIDLAMHLIGEEPEVIDAYAEQNAEGKDQTWCYIDLQFPEVANPVRIKADYTTEPEVRLFWIEGTEATMYVNLLKRTLLVQSKKGKTTFEFQGQGSFDKDYLSEMVHFVNSCKRGWLIEPLAYGEEGLENLYCIMEARELARVI